MNASNLNHNSDRRRVVITGLGAITPLGLNAKDTWQAAIKGQSGIAQITSFDTDIFDVKIAGEVKNYNPDDFIPKKEQKKMGRFIHLSLAATHEALKDCGIDFSDELRTRTGCIIGVGMGDLPGIEAGVHTITQQKPQKLSPFFIPKVISNLASGQISIIHGFKGPNYTVTSACASGNHSIGDAVSFIRSGVCDVMISGGAESTICPLALAGFANMRALSRNNDNPEQASRPWDKGRDGFVLSEGAATVVLEEYEHAKARGAQIYAEVTGYGLSADAFHMTSPPEDGSGAKSAMTMCLNDAQLNPEEIHYINAHGTSTPTGDMIEARAIETLFSNHKDHLVVSSTKSMTGHTLGAAGAIETLFTAMALKTGIVPPTINLNEPEDCGLDFVPHTARELKVDHALNNSFGFGGTNACLILSKI